MRTSGTRVFCVVIRVKVMGSRVKDMSTIIFTQTVTVVIESATTLCACTEVYDVPSETMK